MFKAAVACVLLFLTAIDAECPNGCSGRGSCTSKDMCVCYKNFQGNDCSERTCGFGYAHTDTPKGDLNMDTDTVDAVTTPVYVAGTDEYYYGSAVTDEGHFYMECSNQGLCDRETGDCVCFDGFEGSACQRASCPNSCSGHGSCESISEFASTAGGSLFTKGLATGDTSYDLWDAKVGYGCRCDPWYTGADCSLRTCKVGVDPMFYDTEQVTYETILISYTAADADAWIRIKFWDYWGESYITDRIDNINGVSATVPANIEAALEALPNGVISSDLECEQLSTTVANTKFFPVTMTFSDSKILCQFKSNPGALRLPVIESSTATSTSITGTPLRGEDESLCTQLATETVSALTYTNDGTVRTLTTSADISSSLPSAPFLIKVNDQYAVVSAKSGATLTLQTGLLNEPGTDASATGLSYDLYYSSTLLTDAQAMASGSAVGGTTITLGNSNAFAAKNKIICENQIYTVKAVPTDTTLTIDRPFFGSAVAGAADPTTNCYIIPDATATTSYVAECSARGICDRESGVCTCFKGYTNDNCDKQSILSF